MIEKMEHLDKRILELKMLLGEAESAIVDTGKDDDNASQEYENKLSDEALEDFVDGLLIALGEMEMMGRVPKIETPKQAQAALLGVIRKLYLKRSVVNKMARKFARFGAKQFLRKQRTSLSKSLA